MTAYQSEQRDVVRNLTSSGMTLAHAHRAAADLKKASINAGFTESLRLAEDAMKTARDLYNIEIGLAALDTIVQHSLNETDWNDIVDPSSSA